MKQKKQIETGSPSSANTALGIGFAVIWAVALALLVPAPEKGALEDAATYAGTLFGFGLFFGLFAALVTHLLFLRRQTGRMKALTYILSGLAGGLSIVLLHG